MGTSPTSWCWYFWHLPQRMEISQLMSQEDMADFIQLRSHVGFGEEIAKLDLGGDFWFSCLCSSLFGEDSQIDEVSNRLKPPTLVKGRFPMAGSFAVMRVAPIRSGLFTLSTLFLLVGWGGRHSSLPRQISFKFLSSCPYGTAGIWIFGSIDLYDIYIYIHIYTFTYTFVSFVEFLQSIDTSDTGSRMEQKSQTNLIISSAVEDPNK